MKILFFGDVVGSTGRSAVAKMLPVWKKEYGPDFIVANGENIAHGKGVSRETLQELLAAGVDAVTSGNHVWNFPEASEMLREGKLPLLRPANYSSKLPGTGYKIFNAGTRRILLVNLLAQNAMHVHLNSPFEAIDAILEEYTLPGQDESKETVHAIVLDWHSELTSEKLAMGRHLDGRVSCVFGTHTHVPTADEQVFPGGTGYISDAGMVGPKESILGVEITPNLSRFLLQIPARIPVVETSPAEVNAVLADIDGRTGLCTDIKRLREVVEIA